MASSAVRTPETGSCAVSEPLHLNVLFSEPQSGFASRDAAELAFLVEKVSCIVAPVELGFGDEFHFFLTGLLAHLAAFDFDQYIFRVHSVPPFSLSRFPCL